jgi:hypothetical protein
LSSSGEHRFPARLELGDQVKNIDIVIKVVERRVELVFANGGGIISSVNYDPLYHGQKTVVKALLINTSPFPSTFSFTKIKSDEVEKDEFSDQENDDPSIHFSVTPNDGSLGAFSQIPVTLTFNPTLRQREMGFKSAGDGKPVSSQECIQEMAVEILETEQKIPFQMRGAALHLGVEVSHKEFRFGNCAVNDWQDVMFTIRNLNENPIDFSIDRVAHFHVNPSNGIISGLETQNLILTFMPKQLGTFRNKLSITVAGGLKKIVLQCVGESGAIGQKTKLVGGVDKLHTDFAKEKKFIQTRKASEIGNLERTLLDTDLIKDKTQKYIEEYQPDIPMNKLQEYKQKKDNMDMYNTFLKNTREQKLENAKFKLENLQVNNFLNDVDLGMEPGSGMESPRPSLKATEESLYMTDRIENSASGTSVVRVCSFGYLFQCILLTFIYRNQRNSMRIN